MPQGISKNFDIFLQLIHKDDKFWEILRTRWCEALIHYWQKKPLAILRIQCGGALWDGHVIIY